MKREDIIHAWLDEKQPMQPAGDLAANVMRAIYARRCHRSRLCIFFERLVEFISARPLMRAAAVAAGAGGGAARIGFMIYALLF